MSNIIYLQLDGENTFACAVEVPNRRHCMFKVTFKDSYENIFFTDVETGKWVEEDLGFTQLAQEIGIQIKSFMKAHFHVPKLLTWHNQFINGKLFSFGFFNFMKGRNKLYEIYNPNKKYMYTLVDMDNDEWQILGNPNLTVNKLDPVFADQVIRILPLYSFNIK